MLKSRRIQFRISTAIRESHAIVGRRLPRGSMSPGATDEARASQPNKSIHDDRCPSFWPYRLMKESSMVSSPVVGLETAASFGSLHRRQSPRKSWKGFERGRARAVARAAAHVACGVHEQPTIKKLAAHLDRQSVRSPESQ